MADTVVEKKETSASSPEKKEVEKPAPEIVDEDSKASENGDTEKTTENGTVDDDDSPKETAENGDAKDACIKRKSAGGDAPDGAKTEGATPEKKAKLDEKQAEESNGETETTA